MKIKPKPRPAPLVPKVFWDFYADGVTQSFLGNWLKCREKGKLGMKDGLTQVRGADAFSYGTLTHGTLEECYKLNRLPTPAELEAAIAKALEGVKKENPRMNAEALDKITEQAMIVRSVVNAYFKFWKQDFKQIKWLALEKEFKLPFKLSSGRTTFVRGKRDGDFDAGKPAKLFLFETKTKSRLDEDSLMDWLPLDLQSNLYFWAQRAEYGRIPAGVKYNILKKPGLRQGVNEAFGDYLKRINVDLAKEPNKYFHRYDVAVLSSEIDTWTKEFTKIMDDVEAWWNGLVGLTPTERLTLTEGKHYKNPTACIGQFGACEFLKLCGRGDSSGLFKRPTAFNELAGK